MRRRTLKLDARDWSRQIAAIAADSRHALAEVRFLTSELAGRPPRHRLNGIAYDHGSKQLQVAVREDGPQSPEVRYLVSAPREITVEEFDHATGIVVEDASGVRTLIWLYGGRHALTDLVGARHRVEAPPSSSDSRSRQSRPPSQAW